MDKSVQLLLEALTRRGGKKHREKTDKLAKKLVAMRSKRKNAADTSGDDSDGEAGAGVDMWQVLRQMKARGL